jgi:hypothetical protein
MNAENDKSTAARFEFPPDWGADTLSEFIDKAFHNIAATFVNLPAEYGALRRIHDIFFKITDNLLSASRGSNFSGISPGGESAAVVGG